MNKMYEYFQSVKRSYTYFLATCFLAIGISFSITDTSVINKAITELEAFHNFNFYNEESVKELIKPYYTPKIKELSKSLSLKFRSLLDKYNSFNYGIGSTYNTPGFYPEYKLDQNYQKITINQFLSNFARLNDQNIVLLLPDEVDFEYKIDSLLKSINNENPKYIEFKNLDYDYLKQKVKFFISIFSYDREKDIKSNEKEKIIVIKIKYDKIQYTWLDILYENHKVNEFVKLESNGEYKIFPNLQLTRENIKDVNYNDAILRLKELRANLPAQQTISIFGISINLGPMKYLGPFIITFLFLYFFLHLSNLAKRKPDSSIREYFPWIAIYKGKLEICITYFMIFILPTGSIIAILYGFLTDDSCSNLISMIISIITAFIVIWLGIVVNRILIHLRE